MAALWITPLTRPELIEWLASGVGEPFCTWQSTPLDRYNPSNVGILEDYLQHQIRSEEYHCLANLDILKL